MKPRILSTARLAVPLATAIAALLAVQSASATDYYWNTDGTTIGFGTAGGTWAAPTPGPTAGWTTDSTGATALGSVTTSTSDNLFFGSTAWIPSGGITVSGTVDAGNLTFAAGTGLTLSGGTINLAPASTITVKTANGVTISTALSGAGTSLTMNGYFGPLTLQGANTYGGATTLNGAGLITLNTTGTINSTSGTTFNGATLTLTNIAGEGAVDRLSTGTITSNGGTLNYNNANTAANTYTEGAGTLALTTGQFNTVLGTNQTTSDGQTLTFGGLTQSGTSAVTFSATGTGPQASGNKNMIKVSGKGTTTAGQIIGSWATTGTAANAQSDYAVYNANYVVPANITATGETAWTNSTDAYTSSGALVALSGNRTMAALRNTGGTATITLSDGTTGYTLATNGILNGVTTVLTIAPGTVPGSVTAPGVSGGQIHMTAGTVNGGITVNVPINDNGGAVTLVKNGVGTLILNSTASDYSGGTVINSGILVFGSGTLGSGGITINGGSSGATTYGRLQWAAGNTQDISSSLTMVNGGNANLSTGGNTVSFANAIGSSSSSNLSKVGTGQLTFDANNTYTGETGVYAGTLLINTAQTNTTSVRVGNGTANGGAAGAILRLGVDNALPTNIPVMVDGQGTSTLDLNGFNQTVGHLSLGSNSGGSSGTVSGTGTSKLTLTAGVTADGHNQGGANTAAGLISVPFLDLNGATQNFSTTGATDGRTTLTISSVIQNGGINKTGIAGQLRLSGDNTFSGTTTISGGVLRLDNSLALKNSALDTTASIAGGSVDGLRINTGIATLTLGGLTGNKNFAATGGVFSTSSNNYASVTALTLNPGSGTASYSGVIANGAAGMTLTKTGAGTQSLSNTNLYTGATNVNVGTLSIDGAGTINTSSGVAINGGTFRYNSSTNLSPAVTFTSGTVAGTNWNGTLAGLTVGTGQTISPGNSPGTAATVSQTWASGGAYLWEINNATGTAGSDPGWDLENGTGTLDISATNVSPFNILVTSLTLANAAGLATNFNDATSYNWLIADFNAITGFAANKFFVNTTAFTNTITGTFDVSLGGVGAVPGDSSQIYLTYAPIPEPRAALLGGLGLLALLRRRRA
jgi:autotransporter-associated beta strand protein